MRFYGMDEVFLLRVHGKEDEIPSPTMVSATRPDGDECWFEPLYHSLGEAWGALGAARNIHASLKIFRAYLAIVGGYDKFERDPVPDERVMVVRDPEHIRASRTRVVMVDGFPWGCHEMLYHDIEHALVALRAYGDPNTLAMCVLHTLQEVSCKPAIERTLLPEDAVA